MRCIGWSGLALDGIRVDAVASMIYRDYSREDGQWIPNQHGGRENLEAIEFLKQTNHLLGTEIPVLYQLWKNQPLLLVLLILRMEGGLGFHFKWNMG